VWAFDRNQFCGTPELQSNRPDECWPIFTYCRRSDRYEHTQSSAVENNPNSAWTRWSSLVTDYIRRGWDVQTDDNGASSIVAGCVDVIELLEQCRFCVRYPDWNKQSKQASLFAKLINIHIISMIVTYKGRLPEKPIRTNIAGRLAEKNSKLKKTGKKQTYTCAQCRNTNRLVINRELY